MYSSSENVTDAGSRKGSVINNTSAAVETIPGAAPQSPTADPSTTQKVQASQEDPTNAQPSPHGHSPIVQNNISPSSISLTAPVEQHRHGRAFLNIVVSFLCLGIPHIFAQKTHQHHGGDEEGGWSHVRPAKFTFVVGACSAFLTSTTLISVWAILLSFPGLDKLAQVAGFVTIVLNAFSMGSTLVAMLQYRADSNNLRPATVSGEAQPAISRQSVIYSLPYVFLTYSVIAFALSAGLSSFGRTEDGPPLKLLERPVEDDKAEFSVLRTLGSVLIPMRK